MSHCVYYEEVVNSKIIYCYCTFTTPKIMFQAGDKWVCHTCLRHKPIEQEDE